MSPRAVSPLHTKSAVQKGPPDECPSLGWTAPDTPGSSVLEFSPSTDASTITAPNSSASKLAYKGLSSASESGPRGSPGMNSPTIRPPPAEGQASAVVHAVRSLDFGTGGHQHPVPPGPQGVGFAGVVGSPACSSDGEKATPCIAAQLDASKLADEVDVSNGSHPATPAGSISASAHCPAPPPPSPGHPGKEADPDGDGDVDEWLPLEQVEENPRALIEQVEDADEEVRYVGGHHGEVEAPWIGRTQLSPIREVESTPQMRENSSSPESIPRMGNLQPIHAEPLRAQLTETLDEPVQLQGRERYRHFRSAFFQN
eukprot:TRINITY_DN12477_c2_g1_i1.p1 TRINITY_DN12477_c2_g1~~TRINITY_DN12477_c2_g1_i1.p1  ORF type:complete len:368 (-),score=89.82 TRINITY_DN12477_c2_g1_i1:182-1123(-)